MLFHKVKEVAALPGMKLSVQFANGATKLYDVKPLVARIPAFEALEDEALFGSVEVVRASSPETKTVAWPTRRTSSESMRVRSASFVWPRASRRFLRVPSGCEWAGFWRR